MHGYWRRAGLLPLKLDQFGLQPAGDLTFSVRNFAYDTPHRAVSMVLENITAIPYYFKRFLRDDYVPELHSGSCFLEVIIINVPSHMFVDHLSFCEKKKKGKLLRNFYNNRTMRPEGKLTKRLNAKKSEIDKLTNRHKKIDRG
ncbi:hypothetical protein RRG08_006711 [Elysia crispata]|uniref:Uncharacterized protein n=1 Tax=Elysia crispata TaxID=231223 RepID=A0AAE1BGA3_9GAST|nr:hypothetical protein RRG08_006711 [Elysia crispata]